MTEQVINFDEDESELRAGFTDEEIRKAENKEWHLVPNNTFPEHKILTTQLYCDNGTLTTAKKSMCLVHDLANGGIWNCSQQYQVVPHGALNKLVDTVADEIGIELKMVEHSAMRNSNGHFQEAQNPYSGRKSYFKYNEAGAVISNDGRYMLASYMPEDESQIGSVDVSEVRGGRTDQIQSGITIVNTLDGTTAVHVTPFSLRLWCMNQFHMFLHKVAGWQGDYGSAYAKQIAEKAINAWNHNLKLQEKYGTAGIFLEQLHRGRFLHTKKIEEQALANTIAVQLEFAKGYLNDFVQLAKQPLKQSSVEQIVDAMPVGLNERLSDLKDAVINVERIKETVGTEEKMVNVTTIKNTNKTNYELFNNYTDVLTHDPTASTTLPAHLNKHKKLVEVFNFGQQQAVAQ